MRRILSALLVVVLRARHTRTAKSFDFIWKDLIRYYDKVVAVFENVKIFKRDKRDSGGLFKVSVLDFPFCAV